MITLLLQK